MTGDCGGKEILPRLEWSRIIHRIPNLDDVTAMADSISAASLSLLSRSESGSLSPHAVPVVRGDEALPADAAVEEKP